ncbi:formate/nitrite transporter family protein [Acidiphilium acidophilum]|uniref:formate/nitrite transporter family protein n=1 Tax=Acidiphilium acidophilum TaxID=76588 RepID=UPI002E8E7991|nr:formate/nitrite transporter family protein [Acidiphilium acidophilum]
MGVGMDEDGKAAGSDSPHLDEGEQSQAAQHSGLRPLVIHEIIREEGEDELERSNGALTLSGFAAGLSMGFSFLTEALIRADLPASTWRHLIASFGYSVGFIIAVLGRQQLFTESTLTAILPLLTRRNGETALAVGRLWAIVLAMNLVGTWAFAALLLVHGVFSDAVVGSLGVIAREAIHDAFAATFIRAMFAGWLIALMVWILPSARSARLLTVLLITYVVAIAKLSHIVAGSAEAAYAVLIGTASFGQYLMGFLVPTLLGNIVGGVALVALLNHGTVAEEIQDGIDERGGRKAE